MAKPKGRPKKEVAPATSYGVKYLVLDSNGYSRAYIGPQVYTCVFCSGGYRTKPYECKCIPEFVEYCWSCGSRTCGHQEELVLAWQKKTFYEETPKVSPGVGRLGNA